MSIEFTCANCGQNLRVSEEAAGKNAKCPKCRQINQIPQLPEGGRDDLDDLDLKLTPEVQRAPAASAPGASPLGQQTSNPYSAPQARFGAGIDTTAPARGNGKLQNVQVDVGSILNYSVEVWQNNLGLLLGATIVVIAISLALSFGQMGIVAVLEQAGQREVAFGFNIIGAIGSQLIQIYLGIGFTQMMLNMARRRPAEFTDLFNGATRLLPVLGVVVLYAIALLCGLCLLIIPFIILLLIWWPCYFLVVDNKSSVMESFGDAHGITQGNLNTTFLVWIVGVGISVIGLLACCIGFVFAYPLAGMLWVVAYLMMSGQMPIEPGIAKRAM